MTLLTESLLVLWISTTCVYYGYHVAELNFTHPSLICSSPSSPNPPTPPPSVLLGLPNCLGLTESLYSVATAMFTVGGLIGSIASSRIVLNRGMIGSIKLAAYLNLIASAFMTFAPHSSLLILGRLFSGLSAGLAVCIVAPLLGIIARTSPEHYLSSHTGSVGLLNQVAITSGIVLGQLAGLAGTGMNGDKQGGWRWVVAGDGVMAILQIIAGAWVPDTLVEDREGLLKDKLVEEEGDHDSGIFLPGETSENPETSPLIPSPPNTPIGSTPAPSISALLSSPSLRPPLLLLSFILASQQFSGINATLFYSTSILEKVVPAGAGLVGLGISVVNWGMTWPAVFLIDMVGRKQLLLASIALMIVTCLLTGYGLNTHSTLVTSIALVSSVASFALGLGSIPFLFISELMPPAAVPTTSAFALTLSWTSNFVVALGFLPLRDALSWTLPYGPGQGERDRDVREGEGNVFGVFVACLLVSFWVIWRYLYRL